MKDRYTEKDVVQVLKNVLDFENGLLNLYEDYLAKLEDGDIKRLLTRFRGDEVRHVRSVKELIEGISR
jgi:rubrerythrin